MLLSPEDLATLNTEMEDARKKELDESRVSTEGDASPRSPTARSHFARSIEYVTPRWFREHSSKHSVDVADLISGQVEDLLRVCTHSLSVGAHTSAV